MRKLFIFYLLLFPVTAHAQSVQRSRLYGLLNDEYVYAQKHSLTIVAARDPLSGSCPSSDCGPISTTVATHLDVHGDLEADNLEFNLIQYTRLSKVAPTAAALYLARAYSFAHYYANPDRYLYDVANGPCDCPGLAANGSGTHTGMTFDSLACTDVSCTATGSGATFTIVEDSYTHGYTAYMTNAGTGYDLTGFETGTIKGHRLGGVDGTNDIVIHLTDVRGGGVINSISYASSDAAFFWDHSFGWALKELNALDGDPQWITALNAIHDYMLTHYTPGAIASLNTLVGGSGYTSGTYTGQALTGGAGTGAAANIVVSGGVVTSVTLTGGGGTNYVATNTLSASIPGGSGFSIKVATVGGETACSIKQGLYGTRYNGRLLRIAVVSGDTAWATDIWNNLANSTTLCGSASQGTGTLVAYRTDLGIWQAFNASDIVSNQQQATDVAMLYMGVMGDALGAYYDSLSPGATKTQVGTYITALGHYQKYNWTYQSASTNRNGYADAQAYTNWTHMQANVPVSTDTSANLLHFNNGWDIGNWADINVTCGGIEEVTTDVTSGGLTAGTLYYAAQRPTGTGIIAIYTSASNACADTSRVHFTASVTGRIYRKNGPIIPTSTDTTADTINFTPSAVDYWSGRPVTAQTTGGGLTAGTTYYIRQASAGVASFYTNQDSAIAGGGTNKVDLTSSITSSIAPVIFYHIFDNGGSLGVQVAPIGYTYMAINNLVRTWLLTGDVTYLNAADAQYLSASRTLTGADGTKVTAGQYGYTLGGRDDDSQYEFEGNSEPGYSYMLFKAYNDAQGNYWTQIPFSNMSRLLNEEVLSPAGTPAAPFKAILPNVDWRYNYHDTTVTGGCVDTDDGIVGKFAYSSSIFVPSLGAMIAPATGGHSDYFMSDVDDFLIDSSAGWTAEAPPGRPLITHTGGNCPHSVNQHTFPSYTITSTGITYSNTQFSSHTWGGRDYDGINNRIIAIGGSSWTGEVGGPTFAWFDRTTTQWTESAATLSTVINGMVARFRPFDQRVYFYDMSDFWSIGYADLSPTHYNHFVAPSQALGTGYATGILVGDSTCHTTCYFMTMDVDGTVPTGSGSAANGMMLTYWDINNPTAAPTTLCTVASGLSCTTHLTGASMVYTTGPGIAYNPGDDFLYAYTGALAGVATPTVYKINWHTGAVTALAGSDGGLGPSIYINSSAYQTMNSWGVMADNNRIAFMPNDVTQNMYVYTISGSSPSTPTENDTLTNTAAGSVNTSSSLPETINLGNSGTATSSTTLTVANQLATGVIATACTPGGNVTSVSCGSLPSASGALLSITVNLTTGMAAGSPNGTSVFTIATTSPSSAGTIINYASVDATGGSSPTSPGPSCNTASCGSATTVVNAPVTSHAGRLRVKKPKELFHE